MRELQFSDMFKMSKVISKLELKVDPKGKNQEEFGFELMQSIAENMYKAEDEVMDLFASLKGMSVEEVSKLDLFAVFEEFKSIKGLELFFKQVGQSNKKK